MDGEEKRPENICGVDITGGVPHEFVAGRG
jgi:hypothetical protein